MGISNIEIVQEYIDKYCFVFHEWGQLKRSSRNGPKDMIWPVRGDNTFLVDYVFISPLEDKIVWKREKKAGYNEDWVLYINDKQINDE